MTLTNLLARVSKRKDGKKEGGELCAYDSRTRARLSKWTDQSRLLGQSSCAFDAKSVSSKIVKVVKIVRKDGNND